MKPIMISDGNATASIAKEIAFAGFSSQNNWELDEIKLHLSAAVTAATTFTVTLRSKVSAAYDCVLFSQAMVGVQNLLWQPTRPVKMNGKDRVVCNWTNDAGADAKAYGLLINVKA
jgi:hypothetical protein